MKRTFIFLLFISALQSGAQDLLDSIKVSIDRNKPIVEYLSELESNTPLRFFYLNDWLESFEITPDVNNQTIRQALTSIFKSTELGYSFLYGYAVIIHKDPTREMERDDVIRTAVISKIKVEKLSLGKPGAVKKDRVTLQGVVKDVEHQLPLVGATISIANSDYASSTDSKGNYSLTIPPGEYVMRFRYVNFQEKLINLSIYEDGRGDVQLEEEATTLQEVVVTDQSIVTKRVGQSNIKMLEVSRAPALLGEVDVLRILQTKTGVTAVSEVSAGFNVRGGGADQNLVMFDGTPIFNTSHALGFFTAFNSEAVKEASFYKGGIPAEFGGRVSSVLNMSSKEGDYNKWKGDIGIGFISSSLALGGPIKKDTSSLNISLRSTYSDWVLNYLQSRYNNVAQSGVSFFDGTIKYATKLKNNGKLTASGYGSQDKFRLTNDSTNQWSNQAFSLRYDNVFKSNIYYSVGLHWGSYSYSVTEPDSTTAFKLKYKITYPSLKLDFNRDSHHKQTFGFQTTLYKFYPGILSPKNEESSTGAINIPAETGLESAIYFSDAFLVGPKLNVELGLRVSLYNRLGKGIVYQYQDGVPKEPRYLTDSVSYGKGELMKTYWGPEPRVSLRYNLGSLSSIKLGYNHMLQYVHLISNTAAITPVDIWQASNNYFKPQIADQVSLGYFTSSKNSKYEGFLEGFYKITDNILDFKSGSKLILNKELETALLPGVGKAYGVEFSVEKAKGRLTGALNYTYSRSLRKVNGYYPSEKINDGNYYAANYDQPHILNISWRYSMKRKVFFTGNFVYHTGRPISLPSAAYVVDGVPVIDFPDRNNYRLPNYHRMDLAVVIEGNNKKVKKFESQWIISIYNVYGRRNPYAAYFHYTQAGAVKPYQISLIGVPIPSISYRIRF